MFPFLEFGLNRCLLVWRKNLYVNYNVGLICHFMVDDLCKNVSEWYIHLNRNLGLNQNPLLAKASLFPWKESREMQSWNVRGCVFLVLWGVALLVFVFSSGACFGCCFEKCVTATFFFFSLKAPQGSNSIFKLYETLSPVVSSFLSV